MVESLPDRFGSVFSALSDPTRRAILDRLARGDASVSEIAELFDISLPAISKHLHVLERSGLIARTKDARVHRIRLDARSLKDAADWIEHYRVLWERQLDALAGQLNELENREEKEH
jgi:DNA-binding transcriptional ArsR family regulator